VPGQATSAFQSARPSIQLEGSESALLTDGLLSLVAEEKRDGLYRCEATFGNWGANEGTTTFLHFDRELLDFGKPFAVVGGVGEGGALLFDGRITGIEGHFPDGRTPEITVLAEDRLQDLRMTRRTRTFEDMTDTDVFEQVASAHGLQRRIDIDGGSHRVLAQVNQSDLAFLRERGRAVDAEVWVEGDTFFAKARGRLDRGAVTLVYGGQLRAFSALADLARQRTSLTVSGWDTDAKEEIAAEAGESVLRPELNGFTSGPALLEEAFGRRPEHVVHMAPFGQGEARLLAEARFRAISRRFVSGRGVARGDGRIRVGARVTLEKLGPLFDGEYAVTEARHTFDPRAGFRTRFLVERAGLGSA
jgi:uncharacterized protein